MPRQSFFQRLEHVSHYHQAPGVHPIARKIPPGQQYIELVTGGRGWVRSGPEWVEVTVGALLWHIPGDLTIGRSDLQDPYQCLTAQFDGSARPRRPVPHLSHWPGADEVRRFTRETLRAFLDPSFDRGTLAAYLHARLLYQSRIHHHRVGPASLPNGLRRLLRRIEHDYAAPLRLTDLAADTGWSPAHLHALCRRHLGDTPHRLLIQRRLLAARERLSSSRQPVKQIAAECGFGTDSAFCHLFKKETGQTPAAYRAAQWNLFDVTPDRPPA